MTISVGCGKSDSSPNLPSTSPSPAQINNGLPTLVVDSAHQMRNENSASKPYFVPAAAGLNLQTNEFVFYDPHNLGRSPSMVQVLYEKSVYVMPWNANANEICVLDQSTMKNVKGPPFAGFAMGKRAFVAIGYQTSDAKSPEDGFTPFWIGSVIFH